jgi:hypothetical protein
MFQNAIFKDHKVPGNVGNASLFVYLVRDDDFDIDVEVVAPYGSHPFADVILAVMSVYRAKQLPVVPNLLRAILKEMDDYRTPFTRCIEIMCNIGATQYRNDIEKLMILI